MNGRLFPVVLCAVTIGLSGCSQAALAQPSDSELLVHRLLGLEHPAFFQDGEYKALAAYRAWTELYNRTLQRAADSTAADNRHLKTFLFIGFIARARLDAGTSEAFTADLMPLYGERRDDVLSVLRESPFLIESTCHYLGAFFGFEDRNREGKPAFLEANRGLIERAFPPDPAHTCLTAIEAARNE